MAMNKFEYFGTVAGGMELQLIKEGYDNIVPMFDKDDGFNIRGGNPFASIRSFYSNLVDVTRFGYDQFCNNVSLPSWLTVTSSPLNIDPLNDIFWHDPTNNIWITTSDNIMYHIFK